MQYHDVHVHDQMLMTKDVGASSDGIPHEAVGVAKSTTEKGKKHGGTSRRAKQAS